MNQISNKYGTYEKQMQLLDMIKDVDSILHNQGIIYSLSSGSLLGAVRENGFIPWDDDIDIMVDRENFDKIVDLFSRSNDHDKYVLKRYLWIERIQRKEDKKEGLLADTIDVFVMDNCPDDYFLYKIKILLIKVLQGMMKKDQNYSGQSLFNRIRLFITHLMGIPFKDEVKYNWYQKVSMIGNGKATKNMSGYNDLFKLLPLRYTNKLFKQIIYHPFENTMLPITSEYDSYLKTQYGDYMTPPPEKDRIPVHMI